MNKEKVFTGHVNILIDRKISLNTNTYFFQIITFKEQYRTRKEKLKIQLSDRPTSDLNIQQYAKKSKTSFTNVISIGRQIYEKV